MHRKLCAQQMIYIKHKLLAKSLPRGGLNIEQFNRLYALFEREYKKGKRFEEIAERFFVIYGKKAVSASTIKTWYDAFDLNGRRSARRVVQAPERVATPRPMSNIVDTQSSIRCVFNPLESTMRTDVSNMIFSPHVVDSRYGFYHCIMRLSPFFVVDTFHGDVQ